MKPLALLDSTLRGSYDPAICSAHVPYLTNDERQRLGLENWGSDVPADVVAEAEKRWWAAHPGDPADAQAPPPATETPEAPATASDDVAAVQPSDTTEEAPVAPRRGRKRARDEEGQFLADDPTTPAVNEAFVES